MLYLIMVILLLVMLKQVEFVVLYLLWIYSMVIAAMHAICCLKFNWSYISVYGSWMIQNTFIITRWKYSVRPNFEINVVVTFHQFETRKLIHLLDDGTKNIGFANGIRCILIRNKIFDVILYSTKLLFHDLSNIIKICITILIYGRYSYGIIFQWSYI